MKIYQHHDFSQLYKLSLCDLVQNPEYVITPRSLKIKENTNTVLILEDPLSCLFSNQARSSQKKYIAAELLWYFAGRDDVGYISKYAKFWETIQNPDATVNSSYGKLIFSNRNEHGHTQYEWAISSLAKDKDSRQAILHFNLPKHQHFANRDFVCTMYGIFQIRENRLNLTVTMRSNDVIWGLPTDIAFFAILQSQALSHLRVHYPELQMGSYTHIANSFHVYEHHFDLVDRMLANDFLPEKIPAVASDLITAIGDQTSQFKSLFDSAGAFKNLEDKLFEWINSNIK